MTTVWTNILHRELGKWKTANVELYEQITLEGGGGAKYTGYNLTCWVFSMGKTSWSAGVAWVSGAANILSMLHRSVRNCKIVFKELRSEAIGKWTKNYVRHCRNGFRVCVCVCTYTYIYVYIYDLHAFVISNTEYQSLLFTNWCTIELL